MAQQLQVNHLSEVTGLPRKPLHLAIGMFDGVHLGHRAVVDAAVQSARGAGGISGVLTFWPHPSALFRPDNPTRLMMGAGIKGRMLAAAGVDLVISQRFTLEFSSVPAEDFLPYLKRFLPTLAAIYVGENWRFGQGRRGEIGLLVTEAKKLGLAIVSAARINHNGEAISSTRIREYLEKGMIEEANSILGYTYFAEGIVTPGKSLGRDLGFPTLNVPWEPDVRPRYGVYVVRVSGPKSAGKYPGVANYGLRPTVEQSTEPRLEVHLLGPCPFAGGDTVKVEWVRFLRPEIKFSSLPELIAQIAKDRTQAETFLKSEL